MRHSWRPAAAHRAGLRAASARERLGKMGLTLMSLGDQVQVAAVRFGSPAEKLGLEQGFNITTIELPSGARPDKEWMQVPAYALLFLVWWMQKRRAPQPPSKPNTKAA